MSNESVLSICGDYPSDFVKIDIGSDPNFVFVNDPKFEITNVYDLDGNVASVNSFLECEHYVSPRFVEQYYAVTDNIYQGKDIPPHLLKKSQKKG